MKPISSSARAFRAWARILAAVACASTATAEYPWNLGPVHPEGSYRIVVRVQNDCSTPQFVEFKVLPGAGGIGTPEPLATLVAYILQNSTAEKPVPVAGHGGWISSHGGAVVLGWNGALGMFRHEDTPSCFELKEDLRIEVTPAKAAKASGALTITTPLFTLRPKPAQEARKSPPAKAPEPRPSPPPPSPEVDPSLEIPTISSFDTSPAPDKPPTPPPPGIDPDEEPVKAPPRRLPGGPPGPQVKPVSYFDDLDTLGGLGPDEQPIGGVTMDSGPIDPQWQNIILDLADKLARVVSDGGGVPRRRFDQPPRLAFRSFHSPQAALALPPAFAAAQPAGPGRVILSLIATGASTGEVFQLQVLNGTGMPVQLGGPDGLVVQAIRAGKPMTSISPSKLQKQPVLGFCLDFARQPPPPGTVYQVASRELQKQFRPLRALVRAAQRLADAGGLHPDGDPRKYLDFVKQWSLWTKRESWDLAKFEMHFVDRTKKNLLQLGKKWTPDVEKLVRAAVPGRWRDVQAVLSEVAAARP
jgi:hypothetical protein